MSGVNPFSKSATIPNLPKVNLKLIIKVPLGTSFLFPNASSDICFETYEIYLPCFISAIDNQGVSPIQFFSFLVSGVNPFSKSATFSIVVTSHSG